MSTVLVTGAAGFIGSHLCETLLDTGITVIGIDNFVSGTLDNINRLKQIYGRCFIFREMNVCELSEANMSTNISTIYHLACPACVIKYQEEPVSTLNTCFNGTYAVLKLAREAKAKVIFTSTSEIYGNPTRDVQSENYWGNVNCLGPRSCYDEGKRAAESLIYSYCSQYDVDYTIARVFNTYGPRMVDYRVIPSFLRDAKQGKIIYVHGNGEQTRSFCYVTDTIAALIAMSKISYRGAINIGNTETYTINQLAQIIAEITGCKIGYKTGRIDDPQKRLPDISLAQRILNWRPMVNLRQGLEYIQGDADIYFTE